MAEVQYTLTVKTSDAYSDAGTHSYVYVQLVGKDGVTKTEWMHLDLLFTDNFQVGSVDTFVVQMRDVGLPIILNIKLENWLKDEDEWLCDTIVVERLGESVTFPLYTFVFDSMEFLSGEAVLPQNELCPARLKVREDEIARNKVLYGWASKSEKGLPRTLKTRKYDDLPRLLKRYVLHKKDNFERYNLKSKFHVAIDTITADLKPVKQLDDYKKFAEKLHAEPNRLVERWETDVCQGWQLLNGCNPMDFELCTEIPSYFNVTDEDLEGLLRDGRSIKDEIKEHRLYLTDYTRTYHKDSGIDFMDIPSGGKAFCPPCVALMYISEDGDFVPIAIQLKPENRDYLFTSDGSDDWVLAKMFFRSAHLNTHEWKAHFTHTHMVMEPIAVALYRCLSKAHPVYKLLRRHLCTVPAMNTIARKDLIPNTSVVSEGASVVAATAIRYHFKKLTMNDLVIPRAFEKRGIDVDKIPNCWYARDILKLWNIMEGFVDSLLKGYYKTDKDVVEDMEIQDFAQDFANEGFGWEKGDSKGFPSKFVTIEQLVEFCTLVMLTTSAQHAAVNYGQFNNYSFVPNAPSIMNLPPHKRGEANARRILDTLPTPAQASKAIAMAFGLSQRTHSDELIGSFKDEWFVDKNALECEGNLRTCLDSFAMDVELRNAQLVRKYDRLHPQNVPQTISI